MPFRPIAPSKDVDTSSLQSLGKSVLDLAQWSYVQFNAVAASFQSTEPIKVWSSPPPKPREGTIAYADGTNWNPGTGEGPYFFSSVAGGSAWYPMSADAAWNINLPWVPYAVGLQSGSTGNYTGTGTGLYRTFGKMCFVNIAFVTNTFVAAGYPLFNLPVQSAVGATQTIFGREYQVTGHTLCGVITSGNTVTQIVKYDNTAPITAVNCSLTLTGWYETA